jgi:hypothetical protein
VRRPNVRFFVENHVKGIFVEDTYETPNSELSALGGYLTAKFLWNPDYNQDRAMTEFLDAYYGAAARPVRQYIDLLHDKVERENIHVHLYGPPVRAYLDDALLQRANILWDEAEKQTATYPAALRRVQLSRMSVDYAIVERGRAAANDKPAVELARSRFSPFMQTLEKSGMTYMREGQHIDFPGYRAGLAKALKIEPQSAKR